MTATYDIDYGDDIPVVETLEHTVPQSGIVNLQMCTSEAAKDVKLIVSTK